MKDGLRSILTSGKAPGVAGQALDPGGPDAAIPRALKQLETRHSAREIARQAGWSVNTLKRVWKV